MQAAYALWLAEGAERWPRLRVVFAILGGGSPIQLERLRSRGVGIRDTLYPNVFFDTSSYGTRALELCLATFGVDCLVYGSDTPVIDSRPTLDAVRSFGDAVEDALCRQNPARLLS
jgi:predicted TIM-barrel fold metal-dependent hydrolase